MASPIINHLAVSNWWSLVIVINAVVHSLGPSTCLIELVIVRWAIALLRHEAIDLFEQAIHIIGFNQRPRGFDILNQELRVLLRYVHVFASSMPFQPDGYAL